MNALYLTLHRNNIKVGATELIMQEETFVHFFQCHLYVTCEGVAVPGERHQVEEVPPQVLAVPARLPPRPALLSLG